MSHLGLIIGNAVRRVIGQSTEEELPRLESITTEAKRTAAWLTEAGAKS